MWGLRFTQNGVPGGFAEAYIGVKSVTVTVDCEAVAGADSYVFEMIGSIAYDATPQDPIVLGGSGLSRDFGPNYAGTYVIRVRALDAGGVLLRQDVRAFSCPNTAGQLLPDAQGRDALYNFAGAESGVTRMIVDAVALGGVPGATGPTGPQGPIGPTGPQGDVGPTGPSGASGAIGPTGPSGSAGSTGATGPAGTAGATGASGPTGPAGTDTPYTPTINETPYTIPTTGDATVFLPGGGPFTVKYNAAPSGAGVKVLVFGASDTATNHGTIDPNGKNLNGSASTATIATNYGVHAASYDGVGWRSGTT